MATVPSRPVFLSIRLTTLVVESEMTICDEDTATATGTWLTKAGEPRPGPPATEVSAQHHVGIQSLGFLYRLNAVGGFVNDFPARLYAQ